MNTVHHLTTDTFTTAIEQPGITVIDFWAAWCGPCRAIAPQFEHAAELRPKYRFVRVDVDAELWQTERCPASQRVRQRLTELGLSYLARPVPTAREDRTELETATGVRSIPVLIAGAAIIDGELAILDYLDTHNTEPPDAPEQRAKADKAKRRELEEACPKLTPATH